jgi:hypothetical protein
LEYSPGLAVSARIREIPSNATEGIRINENILFNQAATRHVLAECWNEVEIAINDWHEANGEAYPVKNIEQLHVFSITQHAEMVWREITTDLTCDSIIEHLDEETIIEAIERLKNW